MGCIFHYVCSGVLFCKCGGDHIKTLLGGKMFSLTKEERDAVDAFTPRKRLPDDLIEALQIGRELEEQIRHNLVQAQLKKVVEELGVGFTACGHVYLDLNTWQTLREEAGL